MSVTFGFSQISTIRTMATFRKNLQERPWVSADSHSMFRSRSTLMLSCKIVKKNLGRLPSENTQIVIVRPQGFYSAFVEWPHHPNGFHFLTPGRRQIDLLFNVTYKGKEGLLSHRTNALDNGHGPCGCRPTTATAVAVVAWPRHPNLYCCP